MHPRPARLSGPDELALAELALPVAWHASDRARDALLKGMAVRWRQLGADHEVVGAVVVEPVLAGLEALDDRMPGRPVVGGRVAGQRVIATADMPAGSATTQMQPPPLWACRVTFDAARAAWGASGIDVSHELQSGALFIGLCAPIAANSVCVLLLPQRRGLADLLAGIATITETRPSLPDVEIGA